MTRQQELSRNIGTILLASSMGDIDPCEASALIASLVETEAMHLCAEELKQRRCRDTLRPRIRLAAAAV